jgi:putative spermidine/putrescine transport system ATP-binding protein
MDQFDTIDLIGVRKSYGASVVLRGVDLKIPSGSYATLLGSSGSGKTTLLRIMAGFLSPDVGSVRLAGNDITRLPPKMRNIGMVFQNYALFPHLTARENVEYPLRVRGVAKGQRRKLAEDYLARVQLDGRGNLYPREMSGGQQQRVALARGLVYRPRVLLLDEPLGALDKQLRFDLQRLLKELQRDLSMTFVHVTHDQDEALALSSQVILMREGIIEQVGAPEEVYLRPETEFAARFIGRNVIINCGEVTIEGDRIKVMLINGTVVTLPKSSLSPRTSPEMPYVLCLRTDDAFVVSEPAKADVTLAGVVVETTFMGGHYEVLLDTDVGRVIFGASTHPRRGETLRFCWKPESCRLLPGRPPA